MLLLFVLLVFYIMHIHFLLKNIYLGTSGAGFFMYYIPYRFSRDVAVETLLFCASCTVAFVIGYVLSKCTVDKRSKKFGAKPISEKYMNRAIRLLNMFLVLQIGLGLYAFYRVGFSYSAIFNFKMSMNFLYETRMFALLLLTFVCLNTPPEKWFKEERLRSTRNLLALYLIVSLLMQSRSVVFESAAVIGFCWLMWHGNKIKVKYLVVSLCSIVMPNLIALPRFGSDLDWRTRIDGIFSSEYAVPMNNLVSAAIAGNYRPSRVDLFVSIPSLILPSPMRHVLGATVSYGTAGDYYGWVLEDAGMFGGGLSLLAQIYMHFEWWGICMFVFFGFLIGKMIKGAARVGRVEMLYAAAPLIYVSFILALRNDFATFAKYSIQLILVAMILEFILTRRSRNQEGY